MVDATELAIEGVSTVLLYAIDLFLINVMTKGFMKWKKASGSGRGLHEVEGGFWKWKKASGSGRRLQEVEGGFMKWKGAS